MSDISADNLTIDGIDTRKGLAITRGKVERYLKILNIFYKEGVQKTDEIRACINDKNIDLYTTYVHAMKSASANIGANDLSEYSAKLESAGKQEDWGYICEHTDDYLAELKKILDNIDKALNNNASNTESVALDIKKLSSELREFKQALDSFDSFAINKGTRALKEYSGVAGVGTVIDAILRNKTRGEYDEAASAVDMLLRELDVK